VRRVDLKRIKLLLPALLLLFALSISSFAQEKVRFPIGASSKALGYGPLWLAQRLGFYEREGLDAQIVVMRGTPITIQALATESIFIANAGTDGIIGAIDRGLDLAMIGSLLNNLSMSLVAARPYKTFDDLRGKTIGSQTITTGTGFALRLVLRAHGLEYPRDYQILNIGGVSDRYSALQSGQIAATPLSVPLDITARQKGFNVLGYFADDVPNYFLNPYTIKRSWAEGNRPLVVRFMKAMARTHRWLFDNREAACGYLSKEMAVSLENCKVAWDYSVKNHVWDRNAELSLERVRTMIKIVAEINNQKEPLPSPSKYIDESYLKQALAELNKR
jgi:ABC-type nitrate/sulfonate/bicarbonate transport system substrate-binding protein